MPFIEPSAIEVAVNPFLNRTLLAPYHNALVRRLKLHGGENVLDYGSGCGVLSAKIARALQPNGKLTCVDISQLWLETARHELRRYAHVSFCLGEIGALGLEPASFDLVFMHFVLHDLPANERLPVLQHLAGLLKPGGALFLREPLNPSHGMPAAEIQSLMQQAGLKSLEFMKEKIPLIGNVTTGRFLFEQAA
jgi:ubiquinone/menaquinone biosynthesis C-methylase UbiE